MEGVSNFQLLTNGFFSCMIASLSGLIILEGLIIVHVSNAGLAERKIDGCHLQLISISSCPRIFLYFFS